MSNRRRAKGLPTSHPLAASDGRVFRLQACCDLVITLNTGASSYGLTKIEHDNDCLALDPSTPDGHALRMLANIAVSDAVSNLLGNRADTLNVVVTM